MSRHWLPYSLIAVLGVLSAACHNDLVTPAPNDQPRILAAVAPPADTPPFVVAGGKSTCALRPDKTGICWGEASFGATAITAGAWSTIGSGFFHYCGIRPDQTLECWGYDSDLRAEPPAGTFSALATGSEANCALRTDDTPACWGFSGDGRISPPPGTYKQIGLGAYHGCGILPDDSLTCWGQNGVGQATPPAGTFTSVVGGAYFTCALRTDQTIACFGDSSTPPAGTFKAISANFGGHACAIRTDDTLACWGQNDFGQANPPAGTFLQVSAGWMHTCGVTTARAVVCWGWGETGATNVPAELANPVVPPVAAVGGPYWGSTTQPILMSAGGTDLTYAWDFGDNTTGTGATVSHTYAELGVYPVTLTVTDINGLTATATTTATVESGLPLVAAGLNYSCTVRPAGTAVCWGGNPYGGNAVSATEIFTQLTAGFSTSCGLKADGTIGCYGSDGSGQVNFPAGVFKEVGIGQYHGCALDAAGMLSCWGLNAGHAMDLPAGPYAEVSVGWLNTCAIRPDLTIACAGYFYPSNGGTFAPPAGAFTHVSSAEHHACALKPDRSLVCWGNNTNGEVSGTPSAGFTTQVFPGPYRDVRTGQNHTCALQFDGQPSCWGFNGDGRANPPAGVFTRIAAGPTQSCAERANLTVTCWGDNSAGQLNVPDEFGPPPIARIPFLLAGLEGTLITYDGSTSTGTGLTYAWDFGDGATKTGVAPKHKYADEGSYTVTLTVTDSRGITGTTSRHQLIQNVPPTGTLTTPATAPEDKNLNISIKSLVDPGSADVLEFAFDCGDGAGYGPWSTVKNATCRPSDNGTLDVRGKVRDGDDGENEYTASIIVTNVAPTAKSSAPNQVTEGNAFSFQAIHIDDAPADIPTLEFAFDCGDGTGYGPWGASSARRCTTSDQETRRLKLSVRDKDGGVSEYTDSIVVNNMVPKVTIDSVQSAGPTSQLRGIAFHFVDSGGLDGSPADPQLFDGTVDCGNGTVVSGTYDRSFNLVQCSYAGPGTYTVIVRIQDKDGSFDTDTVKVKVK